MYVYVLTLHYALAYDSDISPKDLLSSQGRFYMVAVKQNDVPGIQYRMRTNNDLESAVSRDFSWQEG